MQHIFQTTKRLICICLVTLVLVTSTLLSFPAPARADCIGLVNICPDGTVNVNGAFAAGVATGSAVTLAATGNAGTLTAAGAGVTAGITAMADAAITAAAPLAAAAAPAAVAAAPVVVPALAVGAVGYGAFRMWEGHQNSQAKPSK